MDMKDKLEEQDDFLDYSKINEEVKDGPSQEEFTKAIDTFSKTDRDIFSDTGIIHVDRDMPAETQAMHVVHLQKEHEKKRKKIVYCIVGLMLVSVVIAFVGLLLNRMTSTLPSQIPVEKSEGADDQDDYVSIDEASFPDPIFRSYILKNFDTNGDDALSPDERNSVIMIIAPQDSALTSVQGISYFPLLQNLTISNTGITSLDLTMNKKLTFVDVSSTPITSIQFPESSVIETMNIANTAMNCEKNNDGYYQGCDIAGE